MHVKLARSAGFCFGVRRAVDEMENLLKDGGPVYTLGPIIHNPQVVADLASRGAVVIDRLRMLPPARRS